MRTKLPLFLAVAIAFVVWIGWSELVGRPGSIRTVETSETAPASRADLPPSVTSLSHDSSSTGAERASVTDLVVDEPPPIASFTHRIIGRIVDDGRFPVSGAQVVVGTLDHTLGQSQSARDGRFEVFVLGEFTGEYTTSILRAGTADDRVAIQKFFLRRATEAEPLDVDAGVLVLGPAHRLHVQVESAGSTAANAIVDVRVGHDRLPLGNLTTDNLGALQLESLPTGPVHLTAQLGASSGGSTVSVPENRRALIQLNAELVAALEIVDAVTAQPVSGAVLDLYQSTSIPAALPSELPVFGDNEYFGSLLLRERVAVTDADGRARIHGLVSGVTYECAVQADGYLDVPTPRGRKPRLTFGPETVRIELQPLSGRRVVWPVKAGDQPIPADGTILELIPMPGGHSPGSEPPVPTSVRMESGQLIAEGVHGKSYWLAKTPTGSMARLYAEDGAETGYETSFLQARRLEVRVRDAHGQPIVGAPIIAMTQGNNELCKAVPTGSDGVAILDGLMQVLATVGLRQPEQRIGVGEPIGTVDLEVGDGKLDVVFEPPVRARTRLDFSIDGVSRLPGQYQLAGRCMPRVIEELPEAGALVIEFQAPAAGESAEVFVKTALYLTARVELLARDPGDDERVAVELHRACVLSVQLRRTDREVIKVSPERFDEDSRKWIPTLFQGRSYPNGPNDSFLFKTSGPGRWRAVEQKSGEVSDEVVIATGDILQSVELDLAVREWVTGRVEAEDEAQLELVRVVLERDGETPAYVDPYGFAQSPGVGLKDGSFRIQVPADEEVGLVALHPWLTPESGTVRVRGGRDGVVLRLVEDDGIVMAVPQLDPRIHITRIGRYAADSKTDGPPIAWHQAAQEDGKLRCSLPSGTWTLWIDPDSEFAPLTLSNVKIDGTTTLPAAEFRTGSTLRVKLLVKPGSDPPRIYARALRDTEPAIQRQRNSGGEAEPLLTGLGPGRYSVSLAMAGSFDRVEREIEVDGSNTVELVMDLR